jgi:hypothetical protein
MGLHLKRNYSKVLPLTVNYTGDNFQLICLFLMEKLDKKTELS